MFPWKPMPLSFDIDRQIEETFGKLIDEKWGRSPASGWQPDIDVYETEDAYLIDADLPGVLPDDFEVKVEGHWVTICGTRRAAQQRRTGQQLWVERRQGRFCRRFSIQHAVVADQITVHQDQGIYLIHMPKQRQPEKETP